MPGLPVLCGLRATTSVQDMKYDLLWEFLIQPALSGTGLGAVDPVIPAVIASFSTLILVSLVQAPPAREKWLPFFDPGSR